MNFEKPSFTTIIEHGNTLVFTSSRVLAERLCKLMITANPPPVEMVIKINQPSDIQVMLQLLREPCNGRLVVAHPQAAAHGWRGQFDRIIWIGEVVSGVYEQAMARADMPWGTPAKLHYEEEELFL